MLSIQNISKTFNPGTVNEKKAIEDLSLELKQGDFATIIGSNGAGKSTLFNAICGDFLTDTGSIELSHLCRSMHAQEALDGFIRIRCVELHRA